MNIQENPRIVIIEGDAYLAGAIKSIQIHPADDPDHGYDNDNMTRVVVYFSESGDYRNYRFAKEAKAIEAHKKAVRAWQMGLGDVVIIDESITRPLHI